MAANAYIMLSVEPAKTHAVIEKLKNVPGALVHEVLGPYDIIVELEAPTTEDLARTLRSSIRPIQGIVATVTCTWIG